METNLGKSLQFLAGAACSASFGWSLKHGLVEALNKRARGNGMGGGVWMKYIINLSSASASLAGCLGELDNAPFG